MFINKTYLYNLSFKLIHLVIEFNNNNLKQFPQLLNLLKAVFQKWSGIEKIVINTDEDSKKEIESNEGL